MSTPLPALRTHGALRHAARLVGGVVEDLDFEQLARVVELADGVDQPVRHVHLVVDRELDGDDRQRAPSGPPARACLSLFFMYR